VELDTDKIDPAVSVEALAAAEPVA